MLNRKMRLVLIIKTMAFAILWVAPVNQILAEEAVYLESTARSGDGIITLLQRYGLHTERCNYDKFYALNDLYHESALIRGRTYKLPVRLYRYDGKSIRTTLGIDEWDQAVAIQKYNERQLQRGHQNEDYRKGGKLWVPHHLTVCYDSHPEVVSTSVRTLNAPIFGENYAEIMLESNRLSERVFYLKSGHGGPDPGAMGNYNGHTICEDEYAYDVTLRLARYLKSHGATVLLIVQDPYDGIRDDHILLCDNTERHYGNRRIPINQLARLNERARIINQLHREQRNKGKKDHLVVSIHIDSRGNHQQQDVFFYYFNRSQTGRQVANQMHRTFKEKYRQHRANGEYRGTVSPRNLYILRHTAPPAVFVELANIQNPIDQKRIILPSNRDALARWMFEGLAGFAP